ncbi:MAG: lipid IV(A) palmitoyltransferase PagP [Neisseria sp.]|nr:lipid IV(A) palmitoyltransferase PagP [Neisseria sp.]
MNINILFAATLCAVSLQATSAYAAETSASDTGWWQSTKDNVAATWASDEYELYLPLRTWHNRSKYSKEKIKEFNEQPWGIGIGKVRDDEKGNTHSIFAMVFADSHYDPETTVAYAWQKNWRVSQNQKVSLGAFAGLTSRSDIMSYTPFPVAWPYVSYSYRKLSIQAMYFPGSKGNGNIAFFWARYRF